MEDFSKEPFKLNTNYEKGFFAELTGSEGFILPTVDLARGDHIQIEISLKLSCMFHVYTIANKGERCGFFFISRFAVENHGGFLLTYLKQHSTADKVDTLIKSDELILYNYPNRGSLAISPMVSSAVANIFETQ